jgi:hypothetical protein
MRQKRRIAHITWVGICAAKNKQRRAPCELVELLVEDIQARGLLVDIMTCKGEILDGRNRYRACRDAAVAPRFTEWDGKGSPLDFVVSMNLRRRHLSNGQRAMIAAKLANLPTAGRPIIAQNCAIVSQASASKALDVSRRSVQAARVVLEHGGSMVEVEEQLIALSRAAAMLNPSRPPHVVTVRRWAELGVSGQKLDSVRIGGQIFTSRRAIRDFIARLNGQATTALEVA